jgi:hypothetical protein
MRVQHLFLSLYLQLLRHIVVSKVVFYLVFAKHLVTIAVFGLILKTYKCTIENLTARTLVHMLLGVTYLAQLFTVIYYGWLDRFLLRF